MKKAYLLVFDRKPPPLLPPLKPLRPLGGLLGWGKPQTEEVPEPPTTCSSLKPFSLGGLGMLGASSSEETGFDYVALHSMLKDSRHILDWWHYIKSCYILISSLPVKELAEEIRKMMPDHHFLLIRVHPDECNGWLPKNAWDWLHKHAGE